MVWVTIKLDISDKELKNLSYQKGCKPFKDKVDFVARQTSIQSSNFR